MARAWKLQSYIKTGGKASSPGPNPKNKVKYENDKKIIIKEANIEYR